MTNRPPYRDSEVHVLARQCGTCIFRPGNLMRLEVGRVEGMVEEAVGADASITCHDTLYRDDVDQAVCRGFFDRYKTTPLRLAVVLGVLVEDPTPRKRN